MMFGDQSTVCGDCRRCVRCDVKFCLDTDPWPPCPEHVDCCYECRPADCEEC